MISAEEARKLAENDDAAFVKAMGRLEDAIKEACKENLKMYKIAYPPALAERVQQELIDNGYKVTTSTTFQPAKGNLVVLKIVW